MAKADTIHFKINTSQLQDLLVKIKDLVKINERLIMKINNDNILLFSFVGESFKNIHAFKNYIFETKSVMDIKESIEESIIFIVKDGRKFYRIMENFLGYDVDVMAKVSFDEDNYVNYISFDNKKYAQKIIGGDPITIGNDISVEDIYYLMDIENSLFSFGLNKVDFGMIKKSSAINKVPKDVLYVNIKENKLSIGETLWHVNICDIQLDNTVISFPKDYFMSMNPTSDIMCYVFDGFILFKYDDYNLMIILETIG